MKNAHYIVVGVLAVLAIAVGAAIYQQQTGSKRSSTNQQEYNSSKSVGSQSAFQSQSTEEINLIKAAPHSSTSNEERRAYREKLEPFAKDADVIEITNCVLSPLIVKTEDKKSYQLKNNDSVEHTVIVNITELKLPANETISFAMGQYNGFMNFSCVGGTQGLLVTK